jgi:hypothetical protein
MLRGDKMNEMNRNEIRLFAIDVDVWMIAKAFGKQVIIEFPLDHKAVWS